MLAVTNVQLVPGFIQLTFENGAKYQIKITDVLRAADIPDLNIDSLTLLTNLAQVVAVIVKTLVDNATLDETLVDGYDLGYVVETLEDELAAEF